MPRDSRKSSVVRAPPFGAVGNSTRTHSPRASPTAEAYSIFSSSTSLSYNLSFFVLGCEEGFVSFGALIIVRRTNV